eukprot:COSAG01_NODE_240_length_20656_cov_53.398259_5_plen_143_part_00
MEDYDCGDSLIFLAHSVVVKCGGLLRQKYEAIPGKNGRKKITNNSPPAGLGFSAAVPGTTACRTGEGAAAERGTVALATRASGLPDREGRPPAASRDPSSSAPKKGRAGGKSDCDTSVTTSVSRHDNVPLVVSSTVDIMKKQ